MRPVLCLLVWAGTTLLAQNSTPPQNPPPTYIESSIVNAANPKGGGLAPNTLVTLFGKHLAYVERALKADDIHSGDLPNALAGAGVRVLVGPLLAPLLYVSPTQINFLVPADILPGRVSVRVALQGRYGTDAQINIAAAAPALFMSDPEFAIASRHADGKVISYASPAAPGDVLIFYATGLGRLQPPPPSGQIVTTPARLQRLSDFSVELDGKRLDRANLFYAGAAPGFAGVYQVNLRLPDDVGPNPEIRIGYADAMSPSGVRVPVGNAK